MGVVPGEHPRLWRARDNAGCASSAAYPTPQPDHSVTSRVRLRQAYPLLYSPSCLLYTKACMSTPPLQTPSTATRPRAIPSLIEWFATSLDSESERTTSASRHRQRYRRAIRRHRDGGPHLAPVLVCPALPALMTAKIRKERRRAKRA